MDTKMYLRPQAAMASPKLKHNKDCVGMPGVYTASHCDHVHGLLLCCIELVKASGYYSIWILNHLSKRKHGKCCLTLFAHDAKDVLGNFHCVAIVYYHQALS